MTKSVSYVLIETIVRRALRDVESSPGRGSRNLVDMAVNFCQGHFQQRFFQNAQHLLRNEHSAFYPLIQDTATHVEHERLLDFGMALGYNSCTLGAKRIREIEAREHFSIPWALQLNMDADASADHMARYRRLLDEGKAMGVYTWFVHAQGSARQMLPLLAEHPDCAFLLFCTPEELDDDFLTALTPIRNIMLVVDMRPGTEQACQALRQRRLLYSVCIRYHDGNLSGVLDDSLIVQAEGMHAIFTAFLPEADCSAATREAVYQYVVQTRAAQRHSTVPWEIRSDSLLVDRIISGDRCSAGFARNGALLLYGRDEPEGRYNLFSIPLREILLGALPRKAVRSSTRL
ncbi:MAG: hypothetical protein ACI4ML_12375 [Aristaeellaceae bacterium]